MSTFDPTGLDPSGTDGLVSAYLDGELDPQASDAFVAQLRTDADLRRELAETEEVRTIVRDLSTPELPAGFLDDLVATGRADDDTVIDLVAARGRRRGRGRIAAFAGAAAAAAALLVAVALPGPNRVDPALATDVRVHQARAAAGGDPVTGLAPLATPLRLGR